MKKILITFLIFYIFRYGVYAEGSCLVKNKAAPSLSKYIENNRKAIRVITNEIGKNTKQKNQNAVTKKLKDEYKAQETAITRVFNRAFDFDNFFANIHFQTEIPKSREVPKEMKRDFKKIKEERKQLSKYIQQILSSGKGDSYIQDFCKKLKIEENCNISDSIQVEVLLSEILLSAKNVETVFLSSFSGDKVGKQNINFVGNNFIEEMQTYYGPQTSGKCSEEDGLGKRIKEQTKSIFESSKFAENGIDKWKEAWNLMLGKDMSKEDRYKKERELLKKELQRQGVSGENQKNLLKNLEKFNQEGGLSVENNFLSNTLSSVIQKVENRVLEFKEEVLDDFFQSKKGNSVANTSVLKANSNSTNSIKIKERIETLYQTQLKFSAVSENTQDNFTDQLINIHLELDNSIMTLGEACKKAVKVCNQQDSGNGKCGSCH